METLQFAPTPTFWHPASILAHLNPLPGIGKLFLRSGLQHDSPWLHTVSVFPPAPYSLLPAHSRDGRQWEGAL